MTHVQQFQYYILKQIALPTLANFSRASFYAENKTKSSETENKTQYGSIKSISPSRLLRRC